MKYVDGQVLPSSSTGKCLGYWWSGDLGAGRAVEENLLRPGGHSFNLVAWESFMEI